MSAAAIPIRLTSFIGCEKETTELTLLLDIPLQAVTLPAETLVDSLQERQQLLLPKCGRQTLADLFPRPKGQVSIGNFFKLAAIRANRIDGILSSRIDACQNQALTIWGPDRC